MKKYSVKTKTKVPSWLDKELKKSKDKGKKIKEKGDEFYKNLTKKHLPKERKGEDELRYIQKVAWNK